MQAGILQSAAERGPARACSVCETRSGSCRKAEDAQHRRRERAAHSVLREPSERRCCGSGLAEAARLGSLSSREFQETAPCYNSGSGKLRSERLANAHSIATQPEGNPAGQSFTPSAASRGLRETSRNDGERDTGEGPAPSPPLCGARSRPGGDGAAIVLGQETGASPRNPRRSRGHGGGGGLAPPPPSRAGPNWPSRGNR